MPFVKEKVLYKGVREILKEGKRFVFVTIADTVNFVTQDFMPEQDVDISKLVPGNFYDATLNVDGRYSRLSLRPSSGALPKTN